MHQRSAFAPLHRSTSRSDARTSNTRARYACALCMCSAESRLDLCGDSAGASSTPFGFEPPNGIVENAARTTTCTHTDTQCSVHPFIRKHSTSNRQPRCKLFGKGATVLSIDFGMPRPQKHSLLLCLAYEVRSVSYMQRCVHERVAFSRLSASCRFAVF